MILHLTRQEKFTRSFIDFIQENFEIKEHFFLLVGGQQKKEFEIEDTRYIKTLKDKNNFLKYFLKFNIKMYKADKIIIHGFSQPYMFIYFSLQPWLLKKTSWLLWGADLYSYKIKKTTIKTTIYEIMRSICIKNFNSIIAYAEGDYDLAKQWYKTKAELKKCLYYPYFAVEDYLKDIELDSNLEENIIMIGNSASPESEHLEVFQKISKLKGIQDYIILCPLSYGNMNYANQIIEYGNKYFGNKFKPLVDFIKSEEYYKLLSKVKIVIMAHKRQQATGNILALVKFEKKIYIRSDISTWNFYKENGIKLFDYENLEEDLFNPIEQREKTNNRAMIKEKFINKRMVQEWSIIFKITKERVK